VDLIDLAQDRDGWRVLFNAAMNRRLPFNAGDSLLAVELLTSQEGPCSMELINCRVLGMDVTSSFT
jgi:hypothetical protein